MANITKLSSMMTTTSGDVVGKVNQLIEMQDESGNNTEKLSRRMSSIFGNMDRMEQSMIVIRKQVNKDIRARERYFSEESKILKKELKNTENLRNGLNTVTQLLAGAGFLSAINQFRQGNIAAGSQDLLFATGSALSAYLPEVITGSAVIISQLLGLNRGRGRGPMMRPNLGSTRNFRPRAGGGRFGLLLPLLTMLGLSTLGGDANADQVRGDLVRNEQNLGNTINAPDVERFRAQLDRFGFLIDRLQSDRPEGTSQNVFTPSGDDLTGKVTSTGLFPSLDTTQGVNIEGLQNIVSSDIGASPNQIGEEGFNVTGATLTDITREQERMKESGAENVGVGMFAIENPQEELERMFKENKLIFNPDKIVFTEKLQRELFLFLLNEKLPEKDRIHIDNLDVLRDKGRLKNIMDVASDVIGGENSLSKDLSNVNDYIRMLNISEGLDPDTGEDESGNKMGMNIINVPGKEKNISQISGNSESTSIKISTNYNSNDGVNIDNFHNLQQYNSPAVFTG